jgi:HSP20 family molecular chaperone IbpA
VRVWGTIDSRPLGAWCLRQGGPPAFICRPDAGKLTIHWQLPGQAEQSVEVTLENKAKTVVLEKK